MADEHRRVESNNAIVGSGMTADPEKIAQLQSEQARMERTYREPPKRSFGDVLEDPETASANPDESSAPEDNAPLEVPLPDDEVDERPRVAPDPRMRSLHAQFSQRKKTK